METLLDMPKSGSNLDAVSRLTAVQLEQIEKQIRVQADGLEHEELLLSTFRVSLRYHRDVMRPYSSRAMTDWIGRNPAFLKGKRIMDMGCGTGIQGIAAMHVGASHVEFVDVMPEAIELSKLNVQANLGTEPDVRFTRSNLFEMTSQDRRFDVIIFAQPYFNGHPIVTAPCTVGMLMPTPRIELFMQNAHDHLGFDGRLFMQSWDFGSEENDPRMLADRFGWRVESRIKLHESTQNVQCGTFELVVLTH